MGWRRMVHLAIRAALAVDGNIAQFGHADDVHRSLADLVHVAEYDLPDPSSEPHGLAVGSDDALYVALEIGEITRMEP
jgi:hypothetical protein